MKELPKMYHNKIDKNINNIQKFYSTIGKERGKEEYNFKVDNYKIQEKIYNIFKSPTYIYKADVTIITKNEKLNKRIIGKNKDYLITIENEYIPINEIKDIYY